MFDKSAGWRLERDAGRQEENVMAKAKPAENEYDDIPGTFVFDAERSRRGYHLNMFCMSLMKAANREAFKADEEKYLDGFPLTPEQREAILKRQYNRMLELGGNIYFTAKLGATDGHSFQHMAAVMTDSSQQDYAAMMLGGGRSVEGNRSKTGRDKIAPRRKAATGKKAAGRATSAKRPAAKSSRAKSSAKSSAAKSSRAKSKASRKGNRRG
jgi:protocatechuate 4,5-dioxygenase alpha chain